MPQEQSFWDFACDVYETDALRDLLLELQDAHHLDVNCLLFCHWCAFTDRGIEDEKFWGNLVQKTKAWQDDIVAPIRSARKAIKYNRYFERDSDFNEYRKQLQEQELIAEKIQIDWIEQQLSDASNYVSLSLDNYLKLYMNALPFELSDKGRDRVLALGSFIF